jgi:hypothetical protein
MLQMQAQAELLRQQPQGNRCTHAAEQSLKTELGSSAQLQWLGNRPDQPTQTAAPALARWLAQVRDNSHASVAEMKLNRISAKRRWRPSPLERQSAARAARQRGRTELSPAMNLSWSRPPAQPCADRANRAIRVRRAAGSGGACWALC